MYRGLGDTDTTACIANCVALAGAAGYQQCITGCCAQYPNDNVCANAGGTQDPSLLCQYFGYGCDVRQTPPSTSAACAANPQSLACFLQNFTTGLGGEVVIVAGVILLALVLVGGRR